jgi:diguanylate cyclase (GGDEF)-like protein
MARRAHDGWSVRAQLVAAVAAVTVVLTGAGAWVAADTLGEARSQAERSARFQAGLAADAVTDALAQAQPTLAGLAAGLPVEALLADPTQCTLSFAELGVFATGHLDVVLPDGRVPCSSLALRGAPAGASHAGAAWLGRPLEEAGAPGPAGVFTDRLTGQRALAVTAPIPGDEGPDGYVAVVLPLAGLTSGLTATYGGPQEYTFTVRDAAGRWLTGPKGTERDGTAQVRGRASVPGLGWAVTAARPEASALAPTRGLLLTQAGLAVAAVVLLVGLLALVNRRIGRPLRRLTDAAAAASRQVSPDPVPQEGPTEVRRLAREFNAMTAARAGYERQLTQHTLHDPLTGLPNRALCLDRITLALHQAADAATVAVLSVDLDRFKLVNASFGYRSGDDLLVAAAARLSAAVDAGTTLARGGGDGFLVVTSGLPGPAAVEGVAARLLDALAVPFPLNGTEVSLTASVGAARGWPGAAAEDLIRDADTAMYAVKEAGGGRFRLIDDALRAASSDRLNLETDLRAAVENDKLDLVYQPVVNLVSGTITGAEALLRWTHPTRGQVPPLTFIPVAEESGLIGRIGRWVIDRACQQAAAWNAAGYRLRVAVNVSGRQLQDPDFVTHVGKALHRSGIDPAQLCLELTETTLMDDAVRISAVLHDLKDLGVDLSVDDFGTGYSSLAYLKRFPVDELKVDRSFVQHLEDEGEDRSLVAAMVAMGHALGLHVVAEGVETRPQVATLLTLGCRTAQGYLFSRPQPVDRVTELLTAEPTTPTQAEPPPEVTLHGPPTTRRGRRHAGGTDATRNG